MALRIVAFQSKFPNTLEDSTGRKIEARTLLQALDFLSEPFEKPGERDLFRVCWDISELCAPIWRFLTKTQAQTLISTNELQLVWPLKEGNLVYQVKYVPRRKFLILQCKGEEWSSVFFSMNQYCPDDYVPKDVLEVKAFAHTVVDACKKMGFYPHSLFSPASIIKPYLEHLDLPVPEDIPEEASLYALRCADKTWREAHILGYFPRIRQYDLRSAYPRIHAELLDYRLGKWIKKDTYDPTAYYGFCNCRVTIYPRTTISPIIYRAKEVGDINLSSRVGSWDEFLTLGEVRFIQKWHIGEVVIKDAWYFYPNVFGRKPMQVFIERLIEAKQAGGDITKKLAKGFLTSTWGLHRQVQEYQQRVGEMFNPVYAAEITSQVRLRVAETIYRHKIKPIHVVVDGFGCVEPVQFTEEEQAMGWEQDYKGPLLNISTGLFHYGTRHPGSLTIGDIKKMIAENPEAPYYSKNKRKMVTLGDALKFNDLQTLGTMHNYRVSIDLLDIQHNRDFPRVPRSGRELMTQQFTSIPYEVGGNK